ncbi:hypothetical protein GS429_18395 [Natronorubrum sp. JWXQ-INN-674]|uniref:Flagellin n=1 Tax=Natronorubrum halalkaliphilum TaxID=2691917 RepID=A0A6B0VSN0_9EURY|nr:hypothetical protein [Natronorubrum halalkaliphilum]MXV63996.1 hypothetical protein [Natronorubrum halalkaliphilum]
MVTDSIRDRRQQDRSNEKDRPDRGQIILIGAITLAFIILGVVVVFNGVLYTETLSSADTGQSASTAETTELEIEQGIGCLIASDEVDESELNDEIRDFNKVYQNATAHSRPAAVNIGNIEENNDGDGRNVTITYDSNDLSYTQTRTIKEGDCPS